MKTGHKWRLIPGTIAYDSILGAMSCWKCHRCGTTATNFSEKSLRKRDVRFLEKCKEIRNLRDVTEVMDP